MSETYYNSQSLWITLYLYLRYLDDQNMAVKPLDPGTRWTVGPWDEGIGGRIVVIDHFLEEDKLMPEDQVNMQEVCPMIQLGEDYCRKHSNLHSKKNVSDFFVVAINLYSLPTYVTE